MEQWFFKWMDADVTTCLVSGVLLVVEYVGSMNGDKPDWCLTSSSIYTKLLMLERIMLL